MHMDADRLAAGLAASAAALAALREQATSRLALRPGSELLDAGCGAGEFAWSVTKRVIPGGRVVGLDINSDLVGRARAAAPARGAEIDFVVGDLRKMPFNDDEFDAVRSERVFQHMASDDWSVAATELTRATRPGGLVQLIDPNHLQGAVAATDTEVARLLMGDSKTLPVTPDAGIHSRAAGCRRAVARDTPSRAGSAARPPPSPLPGTA